MLKKTISFTDYNGNERTEDFFFNLSTAEVTEMELTINGGLTAAVKRALETKDIPMLMGLFKDLIFRSYGEKDADGRRFKKSPEMSKAFSETEAYVKLFMELATDEKAGEEFARNVLPAVTDEQYAKAKADFEG